MMTEIRAASDFLCTLFTRPTTTDVREAFSSYLSALLSKRFADNWNESDGEHGSAARALVWHGHGGGEGYDSDLEAAFLRSICADDRSQLADVFAVPFTLWIDPGCVAVRLGHGPGVYTKSMTVTQHQAASNIKIVYGSVPTQPLPKASPLQPPTLALLPSTPALGGGDPYPQQQPIWTTVSYGEGHALSQRSVSSGGCSVLTVGSRVSSGAMTVTTEDAEEACPSLAAPSSTRGDSESEMDGAYYDDDETSSQLSIEDMMDRIGFANIDIIDDDEDCEGDETIHAEQITDAGRRSPASVTNYDGGNVGVMGGGVRLGGAKKPVSPSKPRSPMVWPTDALVGTQSLPLPLADHAAWSKSAAASHYSMQSFNGAGQYGSSFAMIEGNIVTLPGGAGPLDVKRGRTRGRRSRGRGAGRAARRQAAAMLKAQQEGGGAISGGWEGLVAGHGPTSFEYHSNSADPATRTVQRSITPRLPMHSYSCTFMPPPPPPLPSHTTSYYHPISSAASSVPQFMDAAAMATMPSYITARTAYPSPQQWHASTAVRVHH